MGDKISRSDEPQNEEDLLARIEQAKSEFKRRLLAIIENPLVSDSLRNNPLVKEVLK